VRKEKEKSEKVHKKIYIKKYIKLSACGGVKFNFVYVRVSSNKFNLLEILKNKENVPSQNKENRRRDLVIKSIYIVS